MAREIKDILKIITDSVAADEVLSNNISNASMMSTSNLWAYIVAVAQWSVEKIFDSHKADVELKIASKSTHGKIWYKNKAMAFQFGDSLVGDTDMYETVNTDIQIIKYAACDEGIDGYLTMKVAKEGAPGLSFLTGEWPNAGSSAKITETSGGSGEKLAFYIYMERVKDAGVKLRYVSQIADHLRPVIEIHYDPMVLNTNGERLDGTSMTPVQDSINAYLQNLPFNGEYSNMSLTDALQSVSGVKIPQLLSVETHYGSFDWISIITKHIPEAGWMKVFRAEDYEIDITVTNENGTVVLIDGDLTIKWKPYEDQ